MKTTTGSLGALNQALDQFTDKAKRAQAEARRVQIETTAIERVRGAESDKVAAVTERAGTVLSVERRLATSVEQVEADKVDAVQRAEADKTAIVQLSVGERLALEREAKEQEEQDALDAWNRKVVQDADRANRDEANRKKHADQLAAYERQLAQEAADYESRFTTAEWDARTRRIEQTKRDYANMDWENLQKALKSIDDEYKARFAAEDALKAKKDLHREADTEAARKQQEEEVRINEQRSAAESERLAREERIRQAGIDGYEINLARIREEIAAENRLMEAKKRTNEVSDYSISAISSLRSEIDKLSEAIG